MSSERVRADGLLSATRAGLPGGPPPRRWSERRPGAPWRCLAGFQQADHDARK